MLSRDNRYTHVCAGYLCHNISHVHLILLGLQLTLPVPIMTRRDHSAVVFGCGPSFRVVVIFGGHKSNQVDNPQTETTLLFLGQLKLS